MKKIYIAGKISGECETPELIDKCKDKFNNYGKSLTNDFYESYNVSPNFIYNQNKSIGFTHGFLINSELIKSKEGTWQKYMKNDIAIMITCDEVHMLPDWEDSRGAKIEHRLALDLGIKIVYA